MRSRASTSPAGRAPSSRSTTSRCARIGSRWRSTAIGSVVAAQTIVYTATAGTPGVALSMGAPAAGDRLDFAGGTAEPESGAIVAIANVGSDDAQVDVQATAQSSKQVLAPASVTVAQDDVVWVALGACTAPAKTASGRVHHHPERRALQPRRAVGAERRRSSRRP